MNKKELLRLYAAGERIFARIKINDTALSGVDLSGINLSKAHLMAFNLSDANFSNANLSGARMLGTNLSGANLSGADLTDADCERSKTDNVILVATNLTGAKGFGSGIGAFICKTIEPGGEFVEGPDWIE
ncbi:MULTISPECIES: pentapeptide repeat-containing protein [Kamptonema]|uniref:pentapeptide repeat-containing protein n=1 Tax=Kamptonema TaxID=1501433 RepID=UPI0001DAD257|nr:MULTISPECIES: pentapeptide repeat-containing protein [Kamptonema]CBN58256.1 putative Pentapeptide repeat [Kamptonema sp. PCC 6506]